MNSPTATHITLLARLGDADNSVAWTQFCTRYGGLIRGFALRRGLQAADADDILQDVLLSLSKALPNFTYDPGKGLFRSYLKTVVLHAIFRKSCQKAGAVALGEVDSLTHAAAQAPDVDAIWEAQWRRYHVEQALRTLDGEFSDRDREIFDRVAVAGDDPARIAAESGISVDLVYQIRSRMTRRLSELVKAQVAEEG
jgi:RNA polymerase sigma-70 factor (ECF subfamily)